MNTPQGRSVEQTLRRTIADLREQVETLQERVHQLQALMLPEDWSAPMVLNLTAAERNFFGVLYKHTSPQSAERLIAILYQFRSSGDVPHNNIVAVYVRKIRRKIRPFGLDIATIHGSGYYLPDDTRHKLRHWDDKLDHPH